jgi:poly-gamma-glutamate capsule biosynthesis protein CapA/YwtB (metallophosphatase superfamily)
MYFLIVFFSNCSYHNNSLKILFAGDLMLDRGTKVTIKKNTPSFLFESVKHLLISTDFSIANLECVICDTSLRPLDKKFVFQANPEWLSTIHDNGITHVTVANNHSFDFGEEGLHQTISNLKKFGIYPIGDNSENGTMCLPTIIEKTGIHLAVFSSCFFQQNNTLTCNETASILSENIRVFKKGHPDYFIFVCLHWGIEQNTTPSAVQIEQAHSIINSGADAIIGHHPHVVQTIENFKGKYIFYSIGNFIFDNNHPPSNSGIFTIFSLSKNGIAPVEIIPFTIVHSKPILMNIEESKMFMKELSSVSKDIKLKQYDSLWKLF